MPVRIIPRLDIKAPNLVKGIRLEGLRVLGAPKPFAVEYFDQGADEIFYQDIVASLYGRNQIADLVSETADNIFIPLTVGGGVRTIDGIHEMLRAGADRITINTAAVKNPGLITEAVRRFGSQCISIAIETIRQSDGRWEAFTDNGREHTGLDACDWGKKAVDLGAGELVLTSVDHEGTQRGFDLELLERFADSVPVPVVAHGGAGNLDHILAAARTGVDGIALASVLHYKKLTIHEIKAHLESHGIEVRSNEKCHDC